MLVRILSIQGHWVLVAVLLGFPASPCQCWVWSCFSASLQMHPLFSKSVCHCKRSILGAPRYGKRCLRHWAFVLWVMGFVGWTFAELCNSSQLPALGHPSLTMPAVLLRYKTLEVGVCCRACHCWGGRGSGADICYPQPIVFCCHASSVSLQKSETGNGNTVLLKSASPSFWEACKHVGIDVVEVRHRLCGKKGRAFILESSHTWWDPLVYVRLGDTLKFTLMHCAVLWKWQLNLGSLFAEPIFEPFIVFEVNSDILEAEFFPFFSHATWSHQASGRTCFSLFKIAVLDRETHEKNP